MNSDRSENSGVWSRLAVNKHFIRALVLFVCVVAYVLAYPWLDQNLGGPGRGFCIGYILLAAWFWGLWGGILAALLTTPLIFAIDKITGLDGARGLPLGVFVNLLIGVVSGKLRDLSLQLQEQLLERERAEKKLEAYRDQLEEMVEKRTAELKESFSEIERLKDQLQAENVYLREEIELTCKHDEIIGKSAAIKQVLSKIEQVAETDTTVLVLGETGTGKELVTRAIHKLSSRNGLPAVVPKSWTIC